MVILSTLFWAEMQAVYQKASQKVAEEVVT